MGTDRKVRAYPTTLSLWLKLFRGMQELDSEGYDSDDMGVIID